MPIKIHIKSKLSKKHGSAAADLAPPPNSRNVTQWSYEYVLNRNKTHYLRYPKIIPSFMILNLICS